MIDQNSPAARIHADPTLIAFIPDDRFKGSLRATIAGSMRGDAATSSLVTASYRDGQIHIWTWSARTNVTVTGSRIATQARQIANGSRIKRVVHTDYRSDDAGSATHTVYSKVS